jgi:sec-independent protein translocase protein TatB
VGSVGAPELIVIFLVALIVLGPDKLPSAARQAGKFFGDLRRMMAGFEAEVKSAINDDPIHNAVKDTVGIAKGTLDPNPAQGQPGPPAQPPSLPVPEDPSRN